MFTMKGLFKVNTLLWAGGLIMHIGLLLLIVGHIRVVTDFYFLWDWLRWGEAETHTFSAIAGTSAGVLFMIPLLYLLFRRFSGSVKFLSTPEDYFILVLLVGIAITGMHMRMVLEVDQHAMREFMQGLYKFSWKEVPESAGISFIWHFALVQLLMIYFPFGKLMHTIGSFLNKMVMRS
jgi:nitrate reductase gamma subunit